MKISFSPEIKTVMAVYQWFNEIASADRKSFSSDDVAKHFSNDAKMLTNGKLICTGIKEHYDHFVELNDHYTSMQVDIEKIDARQSGDRIYLHYVIQGVNTQKQTVDIHVMGYMVVHDNKVVLFDEVVAHG